MSTMIKYFATGQINADNIKPNRFLPCVGSPGEGSRIYERNCQDQFSFDYKQAGRINHPSLDYKQNIKDQNRSYNSQNKFFLSKYNYVGKQKESDEKTNDVDDHGQSMHQLSHYSNWKIFKERQFSNQRKQPSEGVNRSSILSKQSFESQSKDQSFTLQRNKSQPNFIPRENNYISKPFLRLDTDFKEQPLIKNIQAVSEDSPNWCQSSNHYYKIENLDSSKKIGAKTSSNTDIFGQAINTHENNFQFKCVNPISNQRFEANRMVIADKESVIQARKIMSRHEMKQGKCKLEWKEDSTKQKFDFPVPLNKIGYTNTPFLKDLERKRNPNKFIFSKVGETEVYTKIDKDKQTLLKIGHGTPSSLNPLKQ